MRRSIAGIVVENGKVLVAKRKEGGAIGLRWEFPGGKVESGEEDEDALRREFAEEFGVKAEPIHCIGTASFVTHSGERLLSAWLVKLPQGCLLELREHSMIAWLHPGELG
ncbi:MAG: NUDIX domain-containing protein, partial [Spirochaetia bacterium]|nr:NUDIX domain-containing protein [Spirochaetia bacterium]